MPEEKEKCIIGDCEHCIKCPIKKNMILPFESTDAELRMLFSYFLYRAPNIESAHSKRIPREKHEEVFEAMMRERHFKNIRFCPSNASIDEELKTAFLTGEDVCLKCKRFVCKRKKTAKNEPRETDLGCFLRHIRNAIAHGMVYKFSNISRRYMMFEDQNGTGKISARIICNKADLSYWRRVLRKNIV